MSMTSAPVNRVFCSVHGWAGHTDGECVVQHPNLMTNEYKLRVRAQQAERTAGTPAGELYARMTCWNCGAGGHTASLCTEPVNEQAVAVSRANWEKRRARFTARGAVDPAPHTPSAPFSSRVLPPHTAGGLAQGGLFSTYPPTATPGTPTFTYGGNQYPPRPSGVPCIEISGWHRNLTTSEAAEAGTSIPGSTGASAIEKGVRLSFASNAQMEAALKQCEDLAFEGKAGKVQSFSAPTLTPGPVPQGNQPPTADGPHSAELAAVHKRLDQNDRRFDRLETKMAGVETGIGSIQKMLQEDREARRKEPSVQRSGKKRSAALQQRRDSESDGDTSDGIGDGDSDMRTGDVVADGPEGKGFRPDPTPAEAQCLERCHRDPCKKGSLYWTVYCSQEESGTTTQWHATPITVTKTKKLGVADFPRIYSYLPDVPSKPKGWMSQQWPFSDGTAAREAAASLQAMQVSTQAGTPTKTG